jgi:acetyl esterase/lipase
MKRKYELNLLENIKKNQREVEYEGVKVLVKPIPEGGEPGDMDPRIYKSMKDMLMLMKFKPKKKKKPETALEQILPLRKMFNGVKSIPIADEGIETTHLTVESTEGYQVPVRMYKRENAGENLPIYVYYHGGGFFGGSPDVVEQMCKVVVQNLDCVAFNIDYRLCPENCYPEPFDDCFLATKWIYDNAESFGGNKDRIAVSGDSAGGNLAAAITMKDKTEGYNMVKMQALIYPATNVSNKHTKYFKGADPSKYQCSKRHEKVFNESQAMMGSMLGADGDSGNFLNDVYLQGKEDPNNIYISPVFGDLTKLPPTILIFGEHDFLVFDNFAYAQSLTEVNNKLKTVVYRGLGHGFADQIGVMPQAEDCMIEIANYMKEVL